MCARMCVYVYTYTQYIYVFLAFRKLGRGLWWFQILILNQIKTNKQKQVKSEIQSTNIYIYNLIG